MIGLSVKTLFLTNVSVLLLSAATSYYFWRLYREYVGLLWWSLATAAAGFATLAFGLFGPFPPIAIGVSSATLFVAGCIMAWESMRRFNGQPAAKGRMAICLLAFVAIFGTALYMGAEMHQRVSVLALALSLFAALSAWEVVRGHRQEPLHSRLPMAVVFAVMAIFLALRAALSWFQPSGSSIESFYDAMGDVVPLVTSIGIVCINIGLMMMATERLSSRYRKRALTDELTDLPNRRFFLEQADRLSRQAQRDRASACILMMDLDHFSGVNERFGHAGGDQALVAFAGLLREQASPKDIFARYGGEEFCAYLADVEAAEAARIAERLRATVAQRAIDVRGQTLNITVSIGVAALHDGDVRASLRYADEALYRAKDRGRDQVVVGPRDWPNSRGVKSSAFGYAAGD